MQIATRFQDKIQHYSKDTKLLEGAFLGMPESVYHSIDAFSQSYAKEFLRSPAHGRAYLDKEWEVDPKREMYKAVHLLTLEPEEQARLVVRDGRWAGALKEEVESLQNRGYIVLKPEALSDAKNMAHSINSNKNARDLLSTSLPEVSLFWTEQTENGPVYCKARVDALGLYEEGIDVGDLKSFGDISEECLLLKQAERLRYDMQQAWYGRGVFKVFGEEPKSFYWVWVEDERPHGVKTRVCPVDFLSRGWGPFVKLLPRYAQCTNENNWPGYDEAVQPLGGFRE